MDIACPECAAAYELDEATIGASGRKVRCVACGSVWRVQPTAPEAAGLRPALDDDERTTAVASETNAAETNAAGTTTPDAATESSPAGPRLLPETPAPRPKAWRRILDVRVAAVALTILVVGAGLHQRERVVRHLPQTAKLYAAVGLPVNLRGIEIRNVRSRMGGDDGETVLVVDGELVNVAGRRVDVPRLHFALLGADGRQVYVWSAQADRTALQPGETLAFRRRLAAPPAEAHEVSVRFLVPSDMTAGIK